MSDWTPHPARCRVVQFFPGHHDCCVKPLETLLRNASLKPPFPRWDGLACVRAQSLQLCPTLCDPMDCSPPGSSVRGDSPGKNTRVGCHALLQEIFLTQGSNPGLPHCRWNLYHLSHRENPRILEWVVYPFSRGFSQPRSQTRVSCIAGGFFTS